MLRRILATARASVRRLPTCNCLHSGEWEELDLLRIWMHNRQAYMCIAWALKPALGTFSQLNDCEHHQSSCCEL